MENKILSHPNLPLNLREGRAAKSAFTLVELIVVITILAILATI
jgi:prepilin-type N-terminal cleavage/methylation domain-containing protein